MEIRLIGGISSELDPTIHFIVTKSQASNSKRSSIDLAVSRGYASVWHIILMLTIKYASMETLIHSKARVGYLRQIY
ncbi:hypothetical protein GCM10027293_06690 [Pontibacter aydingkolensis]